MRTITCLALGVSLALAGCRKPKPSLEYTEAKGLHSTLVAKHGDDAYADPEMDRVVELLAKVPAESLDNAAARELEGFIASERKRIADEAAAHERIMNSVERPPDVTGTTASAPRLPDEGQPESPADAGAASSEPQVGMTVEEVRRLTQECFVSAGTIKIKRGEQQQGDGEMFERVDSGNCRFRYPRHADRVLVFESGKMMGTYDRSQLQTQLRPVPPGGAGGATGTAGAAGGPATPAPSPTPAPPPPPNITPAPPQNELPKPPTTPGEQTGPGQQY